MPKPQAGLAGGLAILLLCSCANQEAAPAENEAAAPAEAKDLSNAGLASPEAPATVANAAADPVPPPDAVSHPDGYLPPAPDPAAANSSGPDESPPATEDEYMRNRQSGR